MTMRALTKLILTFSVLVLPVRAASTTYAYTGNAFNQFYGASGDTSANFMTVSITLASALPASFSGAVTPTAWSISDGTHTITSSTPGVTYTLFNFTTNGGAIISWQVNVDTNSVGLQTYNPAGAYNDGVETVTAYDLYANRGANGVDASNGTAAGTWTAQSAQTGPILGINALLVGSAGGSSSVVLSDGSAWTATSNSPFLHLSAGSTSGTGSGVVVVSYDAFTGTGTRTGTLTIAGLMLTVTQAGTNYIAANPLTTLVSTGLSGPQQVAIDTSGNVYIADSYNNAIKEWSVSTQEVTTLVSSGLNRPFGVAVDGSGNVYIADTFNSAIKEWSVSTQEVTTLVSSGLNHPYGVTVDGWGNVYIADTLNSAIKEWSASTQQVTTLVSSGLLYPGEVAVDSSGNVYIADTNNNAVKEWNAATQQVTTLVSSGLNAPYGVALDGSGNVYIADTGNSAIKEWSASTQQVTALVSSGLNNAYGVAVDGSGDVYIADTINNAVKEIPNTFVGPPTLTESAAAGSDSLLPVLPTTTSLSGILAPTSDQSWLTIGTISGGVINFSFTANTTTTARVAHIMVLGQQITVTQNGLVAPTVSFTGAPVTAAYHSTFAVSATTNASTTAVITASGSCTIAGVTVTISAPSGSCSLLATWAADSNYLAASATQSTAATKATPAINWMTPAAITYGTALSGTQLNATATSNGASVPGTFVYTPAKGAVLTAGPQTLSVTFTPNNASDFVAPPSVSVTLQVTPATPTITWAKPAAITYGTALSGTQLNATTSVPGSLVYSPSAGTVLTAGSQALSVTLTPTDMVNYTTATDTVTITVNKAAPLLTWTTPAPINYGTPLSSVQLDATASVPGNFVYSPAAGAIEAGGSDKLSVTFTPTDAVDYSTATTSVALQVNPATPTITWPTPAAISYGTALTSAQLDAMATNNGASVAGTFVYTPAKGAVLTTGPQTLWVTFIPNNTANYTSTSASVTVQVNQGPVVNVSSFGAVGDGSTDNTTAFVTAFGAACASPTNATVYIPPGIFVVNPSVSQITICSGMTITGTGTIKVASGAGDYDVIFAPSTPSTTVHDFTLADISIDQNADANSTSTISSASGHAQAILRIFVGSNITVRNVKASVSGVNSIDLNGINVSGIVINNNYFVFHKRTAQPMFDNSTIYIDATNYTVSNNVFSSTLSDSAVTAIEVHTGTGSISGNVVSFYQNGMNIVDTQQSQVAGNTITSAQNGILLWAVSSSGMNGANVTGNSITIDNVERGATTSSGISLYYDTAVLGPNSNLSITSNVIVCQQEPLLSVNGYVNYGIGLQSFGSLTNAVVANNQIINAPVRGIKVGVVSPSLASNIQVVGNTIVDPGMNSDRTAEYYDAAIALDGNLTGVTVTGNSLQFTTNPLHPDVSTYSVYAEPGQGATFTQVGVYNNTVIAFAGSPALDLSPAVITSN